jgi:hypothetical protein
LESTGPWVVGLLWVFFILDSDLFLSLSTMVDEADPVDIVKAAAVLAIALRKNQRKQKPKWLKREVKTTEHKALQSKQLLEEESRKQARAKITLNSYFTTS